jgi:hypothetical protein
MGRHQLRRRLVQANLPAVGNLPQGFSGLLGLRFRPGDDDIELIGHLLHIQRRRAGGVGITVAGDLRAGASHRRRPASLWCGPVFRPGALMVRNHHRHVAVAANAERFVQRLENRLKLERKWVV